MLLDFGASLFGSDHSPKFAERIHIEGQVVQFAVIIRNRRIDVVVELGKLVDEVPHFLVRRMEDMRAVAMHVDALYGLCKHVSADVTAFFEHEHAFASLDGKMGEYRAEQAASDHEIIVTFHTSSSATSIRC